MSETVFFGFVSVLILICFAAVLYSMSDVEEVLERR
jgi:hypothetical protein